MTREEHLRFCKQCQNRKMDINQGLVCSLTGQIASFEKECPDFKLDESVKIIVDDTEALDMSEVRKKLPNDIYEKLRLDQNLVSAIIAGCVAGIGGAILWAVFTVTFEFQISWIAMVIGSMVGYSMRTMGKGVDQIFGLFGAGISLLSCMIGNFLSVIGFIAIGQELGYFETLSLFDYSLLPDLFIETFHIMDLAFYAVAVIIGYKLSFRTITEKDIESFGIK